MITVTVREMKEIERKADESGLSYYQMMENAGTQSYRYLLSEYPITNTLLVFCGKGNNGGDGLVVARLAANDGMKVHVVLVEGVPVTEDALTNYNKLPDSVKILDISDSTISNDVRGVSAYLSDNTSNNTVIIDALYGTGFHGELRENGRIACNIMNSLNCPVLALDVPSGCDADGRTACAGAVMADATVVFHAYKNVHVPAIENCGKCTLVSIGIE